MEIIIKKLGGENAAELYKSAKNIYDDFIAGKSQAVVVSAMRSREFNTTDHLIQLGNLLSQEEIDTNAVEKAIEKLELFHIQLLEEKLLCSKEKILEIVHQEFHFLKSSIESYLLLPSKQVPHSLNDYTLFYSSESSFSLIGFGEILSCKIFAGVVDSIFPAPVTAHSVDLSHIVTKTELHGKNEGQVFGLLSEKISNLVLDKEKGGNIPVLSGYIGMFEKGIETAIGRGYTDATAAITTVGLARRGYEVILEIQKSVQGFLSADPRILDCPESAKLIPELDYLIAREITGDCGARARLLHPQAIRSEVQEAGVKIHLYDPFSLGEGSWILDKQTCNIKAHDCRGISFIGGRRQVIFCSISSGKMFERGLLADIFGIVKDYFSVDIVSTSETEVTFTFDAIHLDTTLLRDMTQRIKKKLGFSINTSTEFIKYYKDKALLFCVGEHMRSHVGLLGKIAYTLGKHNINIDMVSQGMLERSIVFGIPERDYKRAINILHDEFIR